MTLTRLFYARPLYQVVNNGEFTTGKIVVYDRARVESEVLPKYFNHSSFASLRRQLNYFAFVRIGKSRQRGAIYSNENVVNLKDILRLKRRAIGGNSTTPDSNVTKSKNLQKISIDPNTLSLQVIADPPITKPNNIRNSDGFDVLFPSGVALVRSVSQSSEDKQDTNSNKRSFSFKQEDTKCGVVPPIHLPLRKKIKFSYESSIAKKNEIQYSQSHLAPSGINPILEHNSKIDHTGQPHREVGVIMGSSLFPNYHKTCIPQHATELHHFEAGSSHQVLPNTSESKNQFIEGFGGEKLSQFGTGFQHSNLKDDEILAGCNALLALNCNSSKAPYLRAGAFLFTQ